jgi:crossover junction endodeoxyribonuclease RuvC
MKLIDALEEDDDVQTVWGNYEVPDEELEKLADDDPRPRSRPRHDRLGLIAAGAIASATSPTARSRPTPRPLPARLADSPTQLEALIAEHRPDAAAVEEVFVNKNPQSTLKLGQARGVVLMIAAARRDRPVGEYAARLVKKAGGRHRRRAEKAQVHAMVQRLLPA